VKMAGLEKLISYEQAALEPETELMLIENGSQITLKPLDGLAFLYHADGEPGHSGVQFFSALQEAINLAPVYCAGTHLLDYSTRKFGTSSLLHIGEWGPGISVCQPPQEIVFAPELTVDFWARFATLNTGGQERALVDRYRNCGSVVNSWLIFMIDGELGMRLNTTQGAVILQTSGLNLAVNTWYHVRAGWSEVQQAACIFLDGEPAAEAGFEGTVRDSLSLNYQSPLEILYSSLAQNVWLDELRIFNSFQAEPFLPPTAPTMPFSRNMPKAVVSLETGFNRAKWLPAGLCFLDESDFENQGILLRLDADDDQTPDFSGPLLKLAEARELAPLTGKWLHLEFSFISDGDIRPTLSSGKINVQTENHILPRREPEIIPRC